MFCNGLYNNNQTSLIKYNDIFYFEGEGAYSKIHSANVIIVISKSLGQVEKESPENIFFRTHNSYIINTTKIEKIELQRSGSITLKNNAIIPVSQRRKNDFLDLLKKIN